MPIRVTHQSIGSGWKAQKMEEDVVVQEQVELEGAVRQEEFTVGVTWLRLRIGRCGRLQPRIRRLQPLEGRERPPGIPVLRPRRGSRSLRRLCGCRCVLHHPGWCASDPGRTPSIPILQIAFVYAPVHIPWKRQAVYEGRPSQLQRRLDRSLGRLGRLVNVRLV